MKIVQIKILTRRAKKSNDRTMTKPSEKKTVQDGTKQTETKARRLREREILFCQGKILGQTDHEAYLNAGYRAKNKATAVVLAQRLLRKGYIQEQLDVLRAEAAERYKLTPNHILEQVGAILTADATDRITWGSKLKAAELGAKILRMVEGDNTPREPITITIIYEDKLAKKKP